MICHETSSCRRQKITGNSVSRRESGSWVSGNFQPVKTRTVLRNSPILPPILEADVTKMATLTPCRFTSFCHSLEAVVCISNPGRLSIQNHASIISSRLPSSMPLECVASALYRFNVSVTLGEMKLFLSDIRWVSSWCCCKE